MKILNMHTDQFWKGEVGIGADVEDEGQSFRVRLLEDIRHGRNEYDAIEIMACPGGCIGGGGQPLHHGHSEILYARANALYREDAGKTIRKSHENPYIKTLYEEFLGKPLSEKAEHLLHTHYFNRSC